MSLPESAAAGVVVLLLLALVQRFGDNKSASSVGPDSNAAFESKPPPPDGDWQPPFPGKPQPGPGHRPPPPPSPLLPLAEIENPIADAPVDQIWTQAKEYAKSHPTNYRDILARLDQVRTKAAGTALEKELEQAIATWSGQRARDLKKEIESFTKQMKRNAQLGHGPHSVAAWEAFPDQLRSAEVDEQIHQIIYDFVLRLPRGPRPGFGQGGPPRGGPPPRQ